ncbi:hypothetical protein [Amphritea sp. HPY]|uniref:hypothetical protein n=1 Tax=Amphritea sp. HPY TaxID=3421652 RepID=UPI003D7E9C7D
MKTSNLFTTLSAWLLGVFLCMGPVAAYAVDDLGLFQLEGNAVDGGATPPDDWQTLYNGGGSANVFSGIITDPDLMSIFDGGKKDIQDIDQWSWKDGAVPDKSDLTHGYAAAYNDVGDLIIYFGADRIANAGDTFMGFWFFKDEVAAENDGSFSGLHQLGDTLVLVNFPQANNAQPEIKVAVWDPSCSKADNNNPQDGDCTAKNLRLSASVSGANAICDNAGAGSAGDQLACAISNAEDGPNDPTPSVWPYTSKDGFVNEFPYETFFEGGINITQLVGGDGCFASFMAETRSSSSFTASLKDFVLGEFELCGISATKDCAADLNSAGDTVTVNFNGTVLNNGAVSLEVTLSDDMGDITDVCFDDGNTAGECGDGNTIPPAINGSVINAGIAGFLLMSGETVLFEGSYIESDPQFDSNGQVFLTDEVTVTATLVNGNVDVVDDMAQATCDVTGIPDIDVNKNCVAAVSSNGTDLDVDISGDGSNNGQLKLLNVTLSDSESASFDLIRIDVSGDGTPDTPVTNGAFDLLPGQAFDYEGSLTVSDPGTLSHSDTVTASGTNFFDQQGPKIEDTGDASCAGDATLILDITKECDVLLEAQASPARIVVKVDFSGVVTNNSNVALSNVSVTDSEAGIVLSNVSLAPGASENYSGSYYPTAASVPTLMASDLSTTDTVNATADGALGTGPVGSDDVTAECYLCDDDDDGIPDVLDDDSGPST